MKSLIVMLRFISRPELRARPIRCLLMAGTVATGVALLTAMHVATQSIVGGFADDLERLGGRADLQVTFGTGEMGFPEEVLEKVAAMPFVEQAAALVRGQVTFEDGETVELFGLDLLQKDVLDLYRVTILDREKDDFTILNDPRGVFVTDAIAQKRSLSVGSKVRLAAVDGVHDYTVRGVVAARGLADFLGGRIIAMYLPAAQPVAGRQGTLTASMIDQIDIRLKPGTNVVDAQSAIDDSLDSGFHAATPLQRRLVGLHTVNGLRATLVGMSSLALFAAIFIVYASTTTLVVQRLPTMATLVSVGAPPTLLVRLVVVEAACLGAAGALAGVATGLMLASFIGGDAAVGMGLNYSLPFDSGRFAWDPAVVLGLHPLGGVVVAACSAYLPARRLRSVTPLVLQREEGSVAHESGFRPSTFLTTAALPALAGMGLLFLGVPRGDATRVSAGGILLIAGAVLAMLPVMRGVWRASVPLLASLFGVAGRIAGENLLRSMNRALTAASAITLSVAIAVGAGSLVQSFRSSVTNWYGFADDVLVSSLSGTGGWMAAPLRGDLEASLRELPGVRDVQTLRVLQGQPYEGERIAVVGLSDRLLRDAIRRGHIAGNLGGEDATRRVRDGVAAVVSRNFLAHFHGNPEHRFVSLFTVNGVVNLPVAAVVPDYVSDKGSVIVSRDLLARHWGDRLVNYFTVKLEAGATPEDLAGTVAASLDSGRGLLVMPTRRMIERVDGLIGQAFADIDTIKLLVLFLTAVGIADLVLSNVLWRRRELGVLRLVGLADKQLVRTARLEGVSIALVAALAGTAVGVLCAWVWVHYNYPVLVGYVLDLRIAWAGILAALAIAAVAAVVAATFAARYALRQPALVALRFE